jgi:hypothetical protein
MASKNIPYDPNSCLILVLEFFAVIVILALGIASYL